LLASKSGNASFLKVCGERDSIFFAIIYSRA
jgi:hypothetical protein